MEKKKDMEMDAEKEQKTCRHRQRKKRDSKRLGFPKILKCQALKNPLAVTYRRVHPDLGSDEWRKQ